jgi:hypothetical protein
MKRLLELSQGLDTELRKRAAIVTGGNVSELIRRILMRDILCELVDEGVEAKSALDMVLPKTGAIRPDSKLIFHPLKETF